jgi:hypothetical protein
MEYRRLGSDGGLDDTKAPYLQMLDDIQSAISYLQSHAAAYHINPNKIALMGHSAGGHLALLYAYMAKQGYYNYGDNIQLVISEAGPTNFLLKDGNGNPISPDSNVCNLVGIMDYSADNTKLFDASPIKYVTVEEGEDAVDVPYTILAYGNGISCGILGDGDGTVAYSQATSLAAELAANKYMLYPLPDIAHLQFGAPNVEGETMQNTVNPLNSTKKVSDYYKLLKEELEDL